MHRLRHRRFDQNAILDRPGFRFLRRHSLQQEGNPAGAPTPRFNRADDVVAVEEVFYSVNAQSALKLGHVRGVALLAAASAGLTVAGYAPLAIKSAVVGYGLAKKEQVQFMVSRLLHLPEPPEPADAADALAIAICHLHTAQTMAGQQGGSTAPNQVTRQPANRSARLSPRASSI